MPKKIVHYKDIKLADSCRYDGVSLGEVMLRLDPFDVPTARATIMRVFQGGGETNVACGMAHTFGLKSAIVNAKAKTMENGYHLREMLIRKGVISA